MSIKDLFDKTKTYLPQTNNKELLDNFESSRNLVQKDILSNTFVPQVDYSEPENFTKFGSAYLYYNSAIKRIYDYFPYDGSDAEINEFINKSLPHEKYIFDTLYPRTNGYANFDGSSYISFKGGPNASAYSQLNELFKTDGTSKRSQANLYETNVYEADNKPSDYGGGSRESNLKCDFQSGVTVEFWLKGPAPSSNSKQTIFHLTNSSGGDALTIYLSGTADSPFHVSLDNSGTSVFADQQIGATPTTSSLTSWNHYAISFKSASAGITTKFYVDGKLDETKNLGGAGVNTLTQKGTLGYIASGSSGYLSASMDEFRFWKTERDAYQIGVNYFSQVRGGTNNDVSNTTLGVYYKFNEGTTDISTIDEIVLDYAGRITNGTWNGNVSRTLKSAIVEAGAAPSEFLDPIIYDNHPSVISLKEDLENKGRFYDSNNQNKFLNYFPSWVVEESENDDKSQLEKVSHIIGAYFDKLYLQIQAVTTLKQPLYTSSSYKPVTFARNLPQSLGLYTPEIFIDSEIINTISNKTEDYNFETKLEDTKNLIYLNLYNNLASIFKSKGTEKAIKGVLRTFYIDDRILRLNTYSNKARYELRNNVEQTIKLNKFINFNSSSNLNAVIYQKQNPSDTTNTIGYISGSGDTGYEFAYGATIEADITFPEFNTRFDTVDRRFTDVSLFGVVSASVTSPDDTTFFGTDNTNFQVFAIRDTEKSKNVYFKLTSSLSPNPLPELTSSNFFGVYNDQDWNISVSVIPNKSGSLKFVTGSGDYDYTLRFEGYNTLLGDVRESFSVEETITKEKGENFLKNAKRVYAGAYRQNITGSVVAKSDVLVSGVRYWTKTIDQVSKKQHALDFDNIGVTDTSQNISALDTNTKDLDVTNQNTLALSWEFGDITNADSSGNFYITDFSSGSATIRDNYGWVGSISGYRHSGYGYGFAASKKAVDEKRINIYKFVDPEKVNSSDMVKVVTDEEEVFGIPEDVVSYHHTLEKSMYNVISEEMLKFFAGVADFNNLIGEPVNRYRMNYKAMEKLRQAFFMRVNDVKEVEKFIEYYKWFDDSLGDIIRQLVPVSAVMSDNIFDVVESHVLERNKYQSKFPTIEFKAADPETPALGIREKTYDWERGHHPVSDSQRENSLYWRLRAERTSATITSGDSEVDSQRDTFIETAGKYNNQKAPTVSDKDRNTYSGQTYVLRHLSRPYKLEVDRRTNPPRIFKGGVNFEVNKNFDYHRAALHPAGPVNTTDNIFIPKNVLLGFTDDLVQLEDTIDPPKNPNVLVKRNIKIQSGRDWEDGVGYKNMKSDIVFPFNIVSSSVRTGYNKQVVERVTASIEIVNLHNDVYGDDMERPMQGPFTEYAVGGLQHRHIKLNDGNDNYLNRPEAWKIALGRCPNTDGAIGMVGADYPYPEANAVGANPYPMTGAQKAYLYRDFVAKRPVNIKNIRHTTGSTILGNYNHNYDVVQAGSAFSTPRQFVEKQPTLPANTFDETTRHATSVRSILDIRRTNEGHTDFNGDYSVDYLHTASGDSVVISRFSAPGGIEVMTKGYQDFRSSTYSVYNALNARNLTVRRPFQGVSSSIVSQTSGLRVYDIHGRDFGLMNHSTRHAARFFRDSTLESNPGASYDERPSFHRTHRNNIVKAREVITYETRYTGSSLTNLSGAFLPRTANQNFIVGIADVRGPSAAVDNTLSSRQAYLNAVTGSGFFMSSWLNFDNAGHSGVRYIYSHGSDGSGNPTVAITHESQDRIKIQVRTNDGGVKFDNAVWELSGLSSLATASYHHLVFAYSGSEGSLSTTLTASAWVNGVQSSLTFGGGVEDIYTDSDQTISNNKIGGWDFDTNSLIVLGGRSGNGQTLEQNWSGSMDEVTLWSKYPTQNDVDELYNSGIPCDVTASAHYLSGTTDLWAWWRFGDVSGDAIDVNNNGHTGSSENIINSVAGNYASDFFLLPLAYSGTPDPIQFVTDVPDGCDPTPYQAPVTSYVCDEKYDNFFVSHQIPRSDRQYAWITSSITNHGCENSPRHWGYMPTAPGPVAPITAPYYRTGRSGYSPFFDYVSASFTTASIFQNTTRLNLLVTDETGSGTNVLGQDPPQAALVSGLDESHKLNTLLTRRGDNYGWGNWRAVRNGDHPLLRIEHQQNQLSLYDNTQITKYNMQPIGFSGRPVLLNAFKRTATSADGSTFDAANTVTFKISHNNKKYGFNEVALNNATGLSPATRETSLNDFVSMIKDNSEYQLNWVSYTENILPSQANAGRTSVTFRDEYDNKYWRDDSEQREILGNSIPNTFDLVVSQSSWPLDPPLNFNSRTSAPPYNENVNIGGGELQNVYSQYFINAPNRDDKVESLSPAALYSRKQMIPTVRSVVSPSGIRIPETGSYVSLEDSLLDIFGGEANWEAGTLAGYLTNSAGTPGFVSAPSEPWFDSYSDFKSDLKFIAKDYTVVPEFRISQHVQDYSNLGVDAELTNMFEIVGTSKDSATTGFYKDYSNSEFLRYFADIAEDTETTPNEIRLVCKAVTRFNPYKGFYPAQRTIDIVGQFASSYRESLSAQAYGTSSFGTDLIENSGSLLKPLTETLFAPGILFNTVKSGLAVDYPVLSSPQAQSLQIEGETYVLSTDHDANGGVGKYTGGKFWDKRAPFEAIIQPDKYLVQTQIYDIESHPSSSLATTASIAAPASDPVYTKMTDNFFAEIGNFFLKNSEYSTIKSSVIEDGITFDSGSVYGARLKMRRSLTGSRTYENDYDSRGITGSTSYFGVNGMRVSASSGVNQGLTTNSIVIPQDPVNNSSLHETFTMYSRTTAFGPAITGRDTWSENSGTLDSLNGFNWSFTPPYYHGEAWADMIFYPDHTKTYTLEQILSEIKVVYWRADQGSTDAEIIGGNNARIYGPANVNDNAMQLDSCLNLFGIERVPFEETNESNLQTTTRNTTAGKRWVIQPKAETPMMDFGDTGPRPITSDSGTLTLPDSFATGSVPRGMWHQFGLLPDSPTKGIFLEIGDIPTNWLRFHYKVTQENSAYNNQDYSSVGETVYQNMKSLTDFMGFEQDSVRLGELKEKTTIREAIVAIPYITNLNGDCGDNINGQLVADQKQFFGIPRERLQAAVDKGTTFGDSEISAGDSVRNIIENVKRYVLPPQFDFVANSNVEPIVMYFFEFGYELDKDDLSYIWQNLAPRNYKKIEKKTQFSAHKLAPNELLQPEDVIENDNLRWMVFKVKQRGMSKYADKIYTQAGRSDRKATTPKGYDVSFNWPYDYVSFVEMINMDVEVMMDNKPQMKTTETTIAKTNLPKTINQDKVNEALEDKIIEDVLNTSGIRR